MTINQEDITLHLLEERDVTHNYSNYGLFALCEDKNHPILCFNVNPSIDLVALDYVSKKAHFDKMHASHKISYQRGEIPKQIDDSTGKHAYLEVSENKKDEFLNALCDALEKQAKSAIPALH